MSCWFFVSMSPSYGKQSTGRSIRESLSDIIKRKDGHYKLWNKASEINARTDSYDEGQELVFINNESIDGGSFIKGRLYLHSMFSLNVLKSIKSMLLNLIHVGQTTESSRNFFLCKYTYKALKCLRNQNPWNVIFFFWI